MGKPFKACNKQLSEVNNSKERLQKFKKKSLEGYSIDLYEQMEQKEDEWDETGKLGGGAW